MLTVSRTWRTAADQRASAEGSTFTPALDQIWAPKSLRLMLSLHQTQYGAIIGTVEIVGCVRNANSPWALPRMWHWMLADARPLRIPIPFKGKLGFFEVPNRRLPASYRG